MAAYANVRVGKLRLKGSDASSSSASRYVAELFLLQSIGGPLTQLNCV